MGEKKAKLTREERKKLAREQKENERKFLKEGLIGPRVKYVPRSFLWNLIAVCLAFFLGMAAIVGGIVGGALFAGSSLTAKKLLGDETSSKLLTDEYAEKSVLDIADALMKTKFESLADIDGFTPLLRSSIEGLDGTLSAFGVHLNIDEFFAQPFSDIGAYFQQSVINNIVIGEALALTPSSDPVMIALFYGVEGEDYIVNEEGKFEMSFGKEPVTLGQLTQDISGMLNRVPVEVLLQTNAQSDSVLRYLSYGTQGVEYEIVDGEIVMLENPVTREPYEKRNLGSIMHDGASIFDDARIGDLMGGQTDSKGFIGAVSDWTVGDLKNSNRVMRLKIGQLVELGGNSSQLMNAIKDWRIEDLSSTDKFDALTLGDVLAISEEDAPQILLALKDTRLGEMQNKMTALRLRDVMKESDLATNKLLRNLTNSTLESLAEDVQDLTVADVFGDEMYSYVKGGAGAYARYLNAYASAYKNSKTDSELLPELAEGAVTAAVYAKGTNKQVVFGYFYERDGKKIQIAEKDVSVKKQDGVSLYYTLLEEAIEGKEEWLRVNFEDGKLYPLEGTVGTVDTENTELTPGVKNDSKTQAVDLQGEPLYYVLAGEETAGTYSPLYEDGFGYFYYVLNENGRTERIDLERKITFPEGSGAVYGKKDGSGKIVGYYTLVETEVLAGYYEADALTDGALAEGAALLGVNETETRYTIGGEEVDRFLHGVWYLIFGDETEEADGTLTPFDNASETKILDLASSVVDTTDRLNGLRLWELYVHGILKANPYAILPGGSNLNDLTIVTAIRYIQSLPTA